MKGFFAGKNILITGGTGSLGQALVRELLKYDPKVIRIFSRDEAKQFDMQQDLEGYKNVRLLLGDVRDANRLRRAMEGIDIVFHTAALKHVPSCEYNPFEAVKTNILGTQNVIELALEHNVERVIYTSTDKSISPTNAMGATKMVAERLISAAEFHKGTRHTKFASVRFGNVMGSRGSVIPLFKKQIMKGGPITVTVPEMTRFMMTIKQAIKLTLQAAKLVIGGEVFVLKMPVVRVRDLAELVIEEFAPLCGYRSEEIRIKYIGLRPGEKMYEELMTQEEAQFATEFADMFAIPSAFSGKTYRYGGGRPAQKRAYSSHEEVLLDKECLRDLLYQEGLLEQRRDNLGLAEVATSVDDERNDNNCG